MRNSREGQKTCSPPRSICSSTPSFGNNGTTEAGASSSGRHSRISRRQILECSWLLHLEDTEWSESEQAALESSSSNPTSQKESTDLDMDFMSYSSTATNDTHTYAIADPSDEIISIASSTFESSSYSGETSLPKLPLTDSSVLGSSERTEVRRVREIFERKKVETESENGIRRPSTRSLVPLPTEDICNNNALKENLQSLTSRELIGCLRGAQSVQQLNKLPSYHLSDVLVNDKIVIEESSQNYPTVNQQGACEFDLQGRTRWPSLRRWKSMGTGVFPSSSMPPKDPSLLRGPSTEKNSMIPAEEMPAPNIVKSVRHVFEQLSSAGGRKDGKPEDRRMSQFQSLKTTYDKWSSKNSFRTPTTNNAIKEASVNEEKKQETIPQLKDANASTSEITAKDIHICPPEIPKYPVHSATMETKSCLNIRNSLSPRPCSIVMEKTKKEGCWNKLKFTENDDDDLELLPEDSSLLTEAPKMISETVLHRIRSFGTTTTYFGGAIIGQTVMNHQILPASSASINTTLQRDSEEALPMENDLTKLDTDNAPNQLPLTLTLQLAHNNTEDDLGPRVVSVLPKLSAQKYDDEVRTPVRKIPTGNELILIPPRTPNDNNILSNAGTPLSDLNNNTILEDQHTTFSQIIIEAARF